MNCFILSTSSEAASSWYDFIRYGLGGIRLKILGRYALSSSVVDPGMTISRTGLLRLRDLAFVSGERVFVLVEIYEISPRTVDPPIGDGDRESECTKL
jgi:hypothetical protein